MLKIKVKRIFIISLFIISYCSFANGQKSIQGTIANSEGKELKMFNIVLLDPSDSSMIKGRTFFEGNFQVKELECDSIIMNVSSLGYEDKNIPVHMSSNNVNIGTITLEIDEVEMEEVVIEGSRDIYTLENDKLVMNVKNTHLEDAGSLKDLLRKSARLKVDEDNNVKIFGKGNAKILINGREVSSNQILSSISSQNIEKVNIQTNPQANLDASGNAIVNVITKEKRRVGINGRLYTSHAYGEYYRNYNSVEGNYKDSSWAVSMYYAYSPEKKKYVDIHERYFDSGLYIKNKVEKIRDFDQDHFTKMSVDYKINRRHEFGVQFRGSFRGNDVDYTNTNHIEPVSGANSVIKSNNNAFVEYSNPTLSFNYTFNPDTSNRKLELFLDRSWYVANKKEKIHETAENITNYYKKDRSNDINLTTLKLDYNHPLKNDWKVKTGAKITSTDNSSKHEFFTRKDSNWIFEEESSDQFSYDESILATYLMIQKSFNKLDLNGGLRLENTNRIGKATSMENSIIDTSYSSLFPSFSLSYKFSEKLNGNVSYSKRINRPHYQDMNPYTIYYDSLSYRKGNPELVPNISQAFEMSLKYRKYASFNIGYTKSDDPIFMAIETQGDSSNITYGMKKNINHSDSYTANIVLPYQTDKWTTYNSVGVKYRENEYEGNGKIFSISHPMWYFYSYHKISLPWDIALNFTFNYYTGGVNGMFKFKKKYTLNAGINKTFFDDKFKITVDWVDILGTDYDDSSTRIRSLYMEHKGYYDRSYIKIKLSYKFNNYKDLFDSKTSSKEERERINNSYE